MLEMIFIVGIAASMIALYKTLSPSSRSSQGLPVKEGDGSKKEIALEALSTIWSRHKNTTISLEQLAGLWRKNAGQLPIEAEDITFQHAEIRDFYEEYVKDRTFSITSAGSVVKEILSLLDREGDCPSVINTKGETEGYLDRNAYDVLAGIKLHEHTLNVAREMIKAFKGSAAMLPKVLIASLGHDLGKLPSYRKTLYSMGDHPLISLTILEGLNGYRELPYKDEINRAIADHHRNPKGLLGEKLKEADHAARRMEVARNVQEHLKEAEPKSDNLQGSSRPEQKAPGMDKTETAKECIFVTHNSEVKEKISVKELSLPWFDADTFLAELKPYINRLDGPRWGAFSMPDGYVYFQTGVLEEVAKKLGKGDTDISLMDSDRELKRNILYSIVCNLRREKDAIARGLIKEGYFGGQFTVRMRDGKEHGFYYTPFNAEAFGETVSYFESLKTGKIKEIEEVYPRVQV